MAAITRTRPWPLRRTLRSWPVALAFLAAAVNFFPLYWLLVGSVNTASRLLPESLVSLIPTSITLDGYILVLQTPKFTRFLFNSVIVATASTLATVIVTSLGAYALARLEFPGRRFVGPLFLFIYTIPAVLLIVPIYLILVQFKLNDTYQGVIISHFVFSIPFVMWMLRGFFLSLPVELEDAGRVDGCTHIGVLWRIVLPLSLPGLIAAALFSFIHSWNEFLFVYVFTISDDVKTLPVGVVARYLYRQVEMSGTHFIQSMAASVIASLPVMVLFVVLQKYLVGGITAGSVKG
ncbi:MAG: carbohydrate ABC transporter permease [Chloroflexi bacterium]|nr:carbohydrate ABC transporter permease [Chloroflexota bacterium]